MAAKSGFLTLLVIGPLIVGCGPPMRWDKAGASAENVQNDQLECRRAAADEAFRNYAFQSGFGIMGPPFWGYRSRPDYFIWRQRLENRPRLLRDAAGQFLHAQQGLHPSAGQRAGRTAQVG